MTGLGLVNVLVALADVRRGCRCRAAPVADARGRMAMPERDGGGASDALFAEALRAGESTRPRAREFLAAPGRRSRLSSPSCAARCRSAFLEEVAATTAVVRAAAACSRRGHEPARAAHAVPAARRRAVLARARGRGGGAAAARRRRGRARSRCCATGSPTCASATASRSRGSRHRPSCRSLLADADVRVVEAALVNPRLREDELVRALRRDDARARSSRRRRRLRGGAALRGAPRPRAAAAHAAPLALQQISSLVPATCSACGGGDTAPARAGGGGGGAGPRLSGN